MITVAVVAILAAIALPSYNDYVLRGKLGEAYSNLAAQATKMEQFFQDNRTYQGGPCGLTGPNFTVSCSGTPDNVTYTLQAVGNAGSGVAAFTFTVDQTGAKGTAVGGGAPSGWTAHSPNNCWVRARGGQCN
jgi:type IV pilus assembly protein PilE